MGKKKGSGSHAGPHKNHGPKRHMFREFGKCLGIAIAKTGVLKKEHSRDSWELSCQARGVKNPTDSMWEEYASLKDDKAKHQWLNDVKAHYVELSKKDAEKAKKAKR